VTDGEKTYRAGMFGGAGTNTLTREFLTRTGLPFDNRRKFLESIERLEKEKVEIFIGNHVENNDTAGKLRAAEESDINPFIDGEAWQRFLNKCREKLEEKIKEEKVF